MALLWKQAKLEEEKSRELQQKTNEGLDQYTRCNEGCAQQIV